MRASPIIHQFTTSPRLALTPDDICSAYVYSRIELRGKITYNWQVTEWTGRIWTDGPFANQSQARDNLRTFLRDWVPR